MPGEALFCGVDVGSSATKLVLVGPDGSLRAEHARPSGVDFGGAAEECLEAALAAAGARRDEVRAATSTGYGRENVGFRTGTATEIQCHGVGCFHHLRRPITVVDIGGQDNKVLALDSDGHRLHFRMNRKCAAGTGAFLEEIAARLQLPLADLEKLAAGTRDAAPLSSFCTVFAKTEILGHLRRGVPVASIVRGAFVAVVARVVEMDPLAGEVVLTGGVAAYNPILAEIFSERLARPAAVAPHPLFTGALGAALIASRPPS